MKIDKKLAVFLAIAGLLGVFLYLSKRKGVMKNEKEDRLADEFSSADRSRTRGQRNNNPFNIRYSSANGWKGQVGSDGAFCVFDTMASGIRAGGVLLRNYLKSDRNTIDKILRSFAPSSENNTDKYIADVSRMSGLDKDKVLSNSDLWQIAVPMMLIESNYRATAADKKSFETT